jgi:hypothetical protein
MKVRTTGTGADCLITPDHGASVVLSSGAEWCPNQAHDRVNPPEPGILTKQQAWLDAQKAKADEPEAEAAAS